MPLERRTQPLLPFGRYLIRLARHLGLSLGIILVFLALGAWGYHAFEGLPWLDATLNAAMILSGMGPVAPLATSAGKLFAIVYALLSGLVFVVVIGIVLTPMMHRVFHRLHLGEGKDAKP